jgi:hypothetical protein
VTQALEILRQAVRAAVRAEGLRGFAERTGVPLGVVRGALGEQNLTAASIDRLAGALGLELYVGPERHRPADGPATGFSEGAEVYRLSPPGPDAWARLDRPAPEAPFFLAGLEGAAGEGVTHGLVEPGAPLEPGMLVYLEDREGRSAVGRHAGVNPATGWVRVHRHGAAMLDERAPGSLSRLWPVTWTGRTPPPAALAAAFGQAVPAERREAVEAIVAELRARLMKMLEQADGRQR